MIWSNQASELQIIYNVRKSGSVGYIVWAGIWKGCRTSLYRSRVVKNPNMPRRVFMISALTLNTNIILYRLIGSAKLTECQELFYLGLVKYSLVGYNIAIFIWSGDQRKGVTLGCCRLHSLCDSDTGSYHFVCLWSYMIPLFGTLVTFMNIFN